MHKLFDWQEEQVESFVSNGCVGLNVSKPGAGKAQPLDSLVATPNGFVKMRDVHIGDEVCDPDGGVARVIGEYPQGTRPTYKITMSDGREVLADEGHLFNVFGRKNNGKRQVTLMSVRQMINKKNSTPSYEQNIRMALRRIEPIEFTKEWPSFITPYQIGLLLGGDSLYNQHSVAYTSIDSECVEEINKLAQSVGLRLRKNGISYHICGTHATSHTIGNPIIDELRRFGMMGILSKNKVIPGAMMYTSSADRLALLQGICDTDGTPCKTGNACDYICASQTLRDQLAWIVYSLGGCATKSEKMVQLAGWSEARKYFRLRFTLPYEACPFRLKRQVNKLHLGGKYTKDLIWIKDISYVGLMETKCIYLDSKNHEYITDGFIRTHNTIVSVLSAKRCGFKVILILGPLSTRRGWQNTVAEDWPEMPFEVINRKKDGKLAYSHLLLGKPGFYFCGQEFFRGRVWTAAKHVDLCIIDEVHKVASNTAEAGRRALKTLKAPKMGLSGTVARNNIENLWGVCQVIWPDMEPWMPDSVYFGWTGRKPTTRGFTSRKPLKDCNPKYKWQFYDLYLDVRKNYFNGYDILGETLPGFILHRAPVAVFHESPDVPSIDKNIYLDMTAKQAKAYRQMVKDNIAWLDENPLVAGLPLTAKLRSRQLTLGEAAVESSLGADGNLHDHLYFNEDSKSPMVDWIIDSALNGDLAGERFVVYTHSRSFSDMLTARLKAKKIDAAAWNGVVSKSDRDTVLEQFISGELRAIVAQIDSIGTGTDGLQTVCHSAVWASESADSTTNEQAKARLERRGQTETVINYHLYMNGTDEAGDHDKRIEDRLKLRRSLKQSVDK